MLNGRRHWADVAFVQAPLGRPGVELQDRSTLVLPPLYRVVPHHAKRSAPLHARTEAEADDASGKVAHIGVAVVEVT
jgi:hypothetical protein